MTRQVLKWAVPVDDGWHPIGAGPVALVEVQNVNHWKAETPERIPVGVVTVWTVEAADGPEAVRPARVWGTGQEVPADVEHLGSCQDGPLVWHLFGSPHLEAPA